MSCLFLADSVEEVRRQIAMARRSVGRDGRAGRSSSWRWIWHWDQLCHLPEVLGGCCEEEFVAGTLWPSESQPIEFENAFEMGEQHLDLLAQPSRHPAFP